MQVQLTLRVSQELYDLMKQGMAKHKHRSMNEFVRTCIRAYLDETGDIIGSRRHFNKRMGERLDRIEAMLLWQSLNTQMLTARGLFTVLDELNPDATQDPPTPEVQLQRASESSKRTLPKFLIEQNGIINDIEAYRRKHKK